MCHRPGMTTDTSQRLQGQTAIVTGAGRGIGRAIAQRFSAEGAAVVVADIDADTGGRTAADIEAAGGRALYVATDVGDRTQVDAMIGTVHDLQEAYHQPMKRRNDTMTLTRKTQRTLLSLLVVDLLALWLVSQNAHAQEANITGMLSPGCCQRTIRLPSFTMGDLWIANRDARVLIG